MVNAVRAIFSLNIDKTAKNPVISAESGVGTHHAKRETNKEVVMREKGVMKKGLVSIFCLLVLTFAALPVGAQTRYRNYNVRRYEQRVAPVYQGNVYSGRRYNDRYWNDNRSFWDEHRDKLTTAIGAGAGAVIGGAIGGTKGAIIGAVAGGGGAALYTYGIRDDNRRRY